MQKRRAAPKANSSSFRHNIIDYLNVNSFLPLDVVVGQICAHHPGGIRAHNYAPMKMRNGIQPFSRE